MDVIIKKSIQEIEEDVWNSIIKENSITKSHAFLLSVERSMSMVNKFWYFLFYEDNQLVGHASLFTHFVKMEDVIGNKQFEMFVEKMRKSLKNLFRIKVLGCGTPIATCSDEITIVDGYLDHDKIMEVLVKEMKKIACIEKVNFIMIRDFTSESAVDKKIFQSYGYKLVNVLPTSFVDIKWDTFEGYVNSFKSSTKAKIKRNRNKFFVEDIEVCIEDDFSMYTNEMICLYNNVYERAEEKFEKLNEDFFAEINRNLLERSKAIIVKKGSNIVAMELVLEDEEILRPLYVGIDYRYNESYKIYFNMIYQIIEMGISRGKKKVELGQTCYHPKKQAGAYVCKMHMYLRFRNDVINYIFGKFLHTLFSDYKDIK